MNYRQKNNGYLKRVEESYNKFAQSYTRVETTPEIIDFDRKILKLIEPLNGKKILDAGCGPGTYSYLMAEKGAHVIGVDISPRLLEIAKERCKNLPNCQFLKTDINSLERCFKNDKFDIVISAFEIMYHKDLNRIFKGYNSVLRQNGQLLILLVHPARNMGMHVPFNYFGKGCYKERWSIGKIDEKYYYKLEDYIDALIENGFCIKKLLEPEPPLGKIAMYDVDIKFPKNSKYPQGLVILLEKIQSMTAHPFTARKFDKICSDIIKMATSPELDIDPGDKTDDKKSFLLGKIMREVFFSDSKYKKLEAYLYLTIVKEFLYSDLGFYWGNFLIISKNEVIYPHIHHFEKSIKLPTARHLGGEESGRLLDLIILLGYGIGKSNKKDGKTIKEGIKDLFEFYRTKKKKLLSPLVDCSHEDILESCCDIAEKIQEIVNEGLSDDMRSDNLNKRIMEAIQEWKLPKIIEDELKKKIEEAGYRNDEHDSLLKIKRWFITIILSQLFDLSMVHGEFPEKLLKTPRSSDVMRTQFEDENSCILVEDGEASLALCMEKLNEMKSLNIDLNIDEFKAYLNEQKILKFNCGNLEPNEKWIRMVNWVEKAFKNEDKNYQPLLEGHPWDLLKSSRIKQLRSDAVEECIKILMEASNPEWGDHINFFRISGKPWQEKFRHLGTEPLNLLSFEITEPTSQILCNFFGLFDFGNLEETFYEKISEKIEKARIFFSLVGHVSVKEEMEKSIEKVTEIDYGNKLAHAFKTPAVTIESLLSQILSEKEEKSYKDLIPKLQRVRALSKDTRGLVDLINIVTSTATTKVALKRAIHKDHKNELNKEEFFFTEENIRKATQDVIFAILHGQTKERFAVSKIQHLLDIKKIRPIHLFDVIGERMKEKNLIEIKNELPTFEFKVSKKFGSQDEKNNFLLNLNVSAKLVYYEFVRNAVIYSESSNPNIKIEVYIVQEDKEESLIFSFENNGRKFNKSYREHDIRGRIGWDLNNHISEIFCWDIEILKSTSDFENRINWKIPITG